MKDKELNNKMDSIEKKLDKILYQMAEQSTSIAVINEKLDKNDKDHEALKPLLEKHEEKLDEHGNFINSTKAVLSFIALVFTGGILTQINKWIK